VKVEIDDLGGGKMRAAIEAGWEEVGPDYEDLLLEYMKLPVPGFRPGRAPRERVEKEFETPLLDDTTARSVRRISRKALDSRGIRATGPLAISAISIERGGAFSFTAEFTELPEFDLPDYTAIPLGADSDSGMRDEISAFLLENTEIEVPDEMVRQELSFDGLQDTDKAGGEWSGALARVRLLLILGAIARQDGIEVDDRDVEERIAQIAEANGTDTASLKKHLILTGGFSRIGSFLLAEMTLDYLIETCRG
jgi:FKBP-type peptidyl-prolyl cis-trans isomerase (trigger factor)